MIFTELVEKENEYRKNPSIENLEKVLFLMYEQLTDRLIHFSKPEETEWLKGNINALDRILGLVQDRPENRRDGFA